MGDWLQMKILIEESVLRRWTELCEKGHGQTVSEELRTALDAAEISALRQQLETERMRLAACGTAALGYFDGCKDEYKSASLDDVLRLRQQLAECERERDELKAYWFDDADPSETKYANEYALVKVGADKGE